VIEKAAGSNSLQQAVDDIKTFANAASYLANSLDTRLKRKEVAGKHTKSSIGKAVAAPVSQPNTVQSGVAQASPASGLPTARSTATSQADFDRLKPQGSQPPIA